MGCDAATGSLPPTPFVIGGEDYEAAGFLNVYGASSRPAPGPPGEKAGGYREIGPEHPDYVPPIGGPDAKMLHEIDAELAKVRLLPKALRLKHGAANQ